MFLILNFERGESYLRHGLVDPLNYLALKPRHFTLRLVSKGSKSQVSSNIFYGNGFHFCFSEENLIFDFFFRFSPLIILREAKSKYKKTSLNILSNSLKVRIFGFRIIGFLLKKIIYDMTTTRWWYYDLANRSFAYSVKLFHFNILNMKNQLWEKNYNHDNQTHGPFSMLSFVLIKQIPWHKLVYLSVFSVFWTFPTTDQLSN